MIVTDIEFAERLFDVLASLDEEEKAEWRETLIAQMEER